MERDATPGWHALSAEAVLERLGATEGGLSEAEARERLARHGPNRLPEQKRRSDLAILLHQFTSPLVYILLVAGVITIFLRHWVDAAVIFAALIFNAVIGFPQERKAERSVEALRKLVAPRARVVRDGHEQEVDGADLVPGDVVLLESGARVPADLRLIAESNLAIDESMLTGESEPVGKQIAPLPEATPLADRTNLAFTGTVVATGRARGVVVATGMDTELGAIAGSVAALPEVETPLQRRMEAFSRLVGIAALSAAVVSFGVGLARGGSFAEMFLVGVALAVAAVPESLPAVFTITLAVGVRRMARRRAIVRRLPAVETLGSTTVIGTDKTGTLTENRMTVQRIHAAGRSWAPGELPADETHPARLVLLAGVLDNEADLWERGGETRSSGDPTEVALLAAAARAGIDPVEARVQLPVFASVPFESERRYSATVREHGRALRLWVKGAPERVIAMCGDALGEAGVVPLDREAVLACAEELAADGLRVLAMATRALPYEAWPRNGEPPEPEQLTFLGLVGMLDPPREGVPEAIATLRRAGVRVLMITGDHAATARTIGVKLGLTTPDRPIVHGVDVEQMDDEALRAKVAEAEIFARMAPEHKLRVVHALHANGEVVAVTGDGVNDAPALRAADIGIAMGRSGTDVAREAADMVLATDDFVSIGAAVEQGRYTFDNLRKVIFFLASVSFAAILVVLGSLVLGWQLPLVPAQLLWINLVTTGLQDVTLALEPGDPALLDRPPRDPREGIVSRVIWERTVIAGVLIAAGTLLNFHWTIEETGSLPLARSVAVTTIVLFTAFHVGNARSEFRSVFRMSPFSNRWLLLVTGGAVAVHLAALHLPATRFVLRVVPIVDGGIWLRMIGVAATILLAMEIHKRVRRA